MSAPSGGPCAATQVTLARGVRALRLENDRLTATVLPDKGADIYQLIDKRSGKVSYAVLSFGGFLGMGDDHYPLPWQSLKYDTNLGGYRTGITQQQLEGAPKYRSDNDWNWGDQTRTRGVDDYYGVIPV